ncbi:MAG TPA: hypothetical protein VIL30_17110 [Ramlibacter sp.]
MNIPVRRIVTTGTLGLIALVLAAVGLLVLPAYGAFMVIWMHVPLATILTTIGPLIGLFSVAAYFACRASWRVCKESM